AAAPRDTVTVGRTLGQHAVPTTFGLTCAGWLVALDEARSGLAEARYGLPVQLGGAAGTLSALGGDGIAVLGLLAAELGLPVPVLPWHTNRIPIAALAAAVAITAGPPGKIALDV